MPKVQHAVNEKGAPVSNFKWQLEAMGGRSFEVADASAAQAKVAELFPAAKVVCSAVPEVPGNRRVESGDNPHSVNDADVGVVRRALGVRTGDIEGVIIHGVQGTRSLTVLLIGRDPENPEP